MTLATILVVYFFSLGGPSLHPSVPGVGVFAAREQGASASQPQAPPAQTTSPEPAAAPPAGPPQDSPSAAKPSAKTPGHGKKTSSPDCTNSPAPMNPVGGGTKGVTSAGATPGGSADAHSGQSEPAKATAVTAKPCPPPKVVIKNGGSDEPIVELKGNTSEEQASQQRFTTEQLTTSTEENLKKIAGRQLSPSEQEVVSQIKQFTQQAKAAIAAGDLLRGRNLALKAHLLSDELIKP